MDQRKKKRHNPPIFDDEESAVDAFDMNNDAAGFSRKTFDTKRFKKDMKKVALALLGTTLAYFPISVVAYMINAPGKAFWVSKNNSCGCDEKPEDLVEQFDENIKLFYSEGRRTSGPNWFAGYHNELIVHKENDDAWWILKDLEGEKSIERPDWKSATLEEVTLIVPKRYEKIYTLADTQGDTEESAAAKAIFQKATEVYNSQRDALRKRLNIGVENAKTSLDGLK